MARVIWKTRYEIIGIHNIPFSNGWILKKNPIRLSKSRSGNFFPNNLKNDLVKISRTCNRLLIMQSAFQQVWYEIIYGFRLKKILKIITDLSPENFNRFRLIYTKKTKKTIVWAKAVVKHKYDERYLAINLLINLIKKSRFHHWYTIPGVSNKKLIQQRVGPLKKNCLWIFFCYDYSLRDFYCAIRTNV